MEIGWTHAAFVVINAAGKPAEILVALKLPDGVGSRFERKVRFVAVAKYLPVSGAKMSRVGVGAVGASSQYTAKPARVSVHVAQPAAFPTTFNRIGRDRLFCCLVPRTIETAAAAEQQHGKDCGQVQDTIHEQNICRVEPV